MRVPERLSCLTELRRGVPPVWKRESERKGERERESESESERERERLLCVFCARQRGEERVEGLQGGVLEGRGGEGGSWCPIQEQYRLALTGGVPTRLKGVLGPVQGFLAHKKQPPPRTLRYAYA